MEEKVIGKAGRGKNVPVTPADDTMTSYMFSLPQSSSRPPKPQFPCGKCKRENVVESQWQYFCPECMESMKLGADRETGGTRIV